MRCVQIRSFRKSFLEIRYFVCRSCVELGACGLLRRVNWSKFTDVSGRLVGPIFWVRRRMRGTESRWWNQQQDVTKRECILTAWRRAATQKHREHSLNSHILILLSWRHVCCVYEIWGYCSGVAEESKFHGTSLCVAWWLLSRRFETSVNSTSQHGVTSQKTCISVSKIYLKVIRNFVRILRCSYSSRVCVSTTLITSWTVHCVWNQENVVGMVTAAGSTAKESLFNSR
jgi:hypothetical protein